MGNAQTAANGEGVEKARGMHSIKHIIKLQIIMEIKYTFPAGSIPRIPRAFSVHSPHATATFLGGVGKSPRI